MLALSDWIDRAAEVTASRLLPKVIALQTLAVLVLLVHPVEGLITSVAFVLYVGFSTTVNSLNLKLYADAEHAGSRINYAFTRGMGSVAYVLISVALGFLAEWVSYQAVPMLGLLICAFQYLAFLSFSRFVVERE